jgi:hypothetical protein
MKAVEREGRKKNFFIALVVFDYFYYSIKVSKYLKMNRKENKREYFWIYFCVLFSN